MCANDLHQNRRGTSPLVTVLSVVAVCLCAALPAWAATVSNQLVGEVFITIADGPKTQELAALGVTDGARATLVLDVDDQAVGETDENGTTYTDAITRYTISIGQFRATMDPDGFNIVVVKDAQADVFVANSSMLSTDNVLGDFASSIMSLAEIGSGAIDDENVGQNLNRFDVGALAVGGADAQVSITFFDNLPALPACVRSQIRAGAEYCRAVLRCYAKRAQDPEGDSLAGCLAAADAAFADDFDDATDDGGVCSSSVDGNGAVDALSEGVAPLNNLVSQSADPGSEDDQKYRSKILKASSDAVDKALRLYAKDAKKPNPKKLKKKLKKNKKALKAAVAKAGNKATKAGLTPDVEGSDVADEVDAIVDAVRDLSNGL